MIELELWLRGQRLRTLKFDQDVIFIGRDENNDIPLEDRNASRHHVRIVRNEEGYELEELGSLNGTKHNEQPMTQAKIQLQPQDRIRIGAHVLVILELESLERTRVARYKNLDPPPPRDQAASWQITVEKEGVPVLIKPLAEDVLILGRDSSCGIPLQDEDISRQHAKLLHKHGKYYIEDMDSLNGTIVDGEPVYSARLTPSTEVRIGPFLLRLVPVDSAAAPQELTQCRRCQRSVSPQWPQCPFCHEAREAPRQLTMTLEPLKASDPAVLALSSEDQLELSFETVASEEHFWVSFDEPDFGLHPVGKVPDSAYGCQNCWAEMVEKPSHWVCPACRASLRQPMDVKSMLIEWMKKGSVQVRLVQVTPKPGRSPVVRVQIQSTRATRGAQRTSSSAGALPRS